MKMAGRIKAERNIIIFIILIGIFFLALPHIIRMFAGNSLLIGDEAYYHLRISEQLIKERSYTLADNGIIGGRSYELNPYDAALAASGLLIGNELASRALPIIFGILSLILFSVILRHYGMLRRNRAMVCLMLALTPAFTYAFSASNSESIVAFLIIAAIYSAIKQGLAWKSLSIALFLIAASTSAFAALLIILILMLHFISDIRRHTAALWGALIVLLFTVIYSPGYSYYSEGIIKGTISDLGATAGFSAFNLILAALGVIYFWRKKKSHFFVYGTLLFMIAGLPLFGSIVNIYLAFVLAIFSSFGISFIIERHWELSAVKNSAILILIIGLIFSSMTFAIRLAASEPNNEIKEGLEFLREQEDGAVLSHASNGFWIEYFAGKTVLEDRMTKNNLSRTLFYTRNLEEAKGIMKNSSIRYIWIDQNMKSGEVWSKQEEGILFLFRNNETFKSIYSENGIEIWSIKGG